MYIRTGFDPMPWPRACCGIAGLGNGKAVPIREKKVKALIKAKDPDAFALLKPLRIPCPLRSGKCVFTEVKRAAAAGTADQRSAFAFGRPWTNALTAKAYSEIVAGRLASAGTAAPDQRAWKLRILDLINAVSAWYDAIDAKRATPEILPRGGRFAPIIQLEPAILRL
jgi:hypothetical protein